MREKAKLFDGSWQQVGDPWPGLGQAFIVTYDLG